MILDQFNRPIQAALPEVEAAVPGMRTGGWAEAGTVDPGANRAYGIDRETQRRASRLAYYVNPLISGLVGNILVPYVVGDDFSYGVLDDRDARLALDEFWAHNDLASLGERIWTEYLIDGESAVVFERDREGDAAPARIGLVDLDKGIKLEHDTMNGVTAIETQGPKFTRAVWEQGEFVWTAHSALFNDPRGWPVMMQAIPAALSYIGLINSRLRMHDIQARINGVYKAFYKNGEDDKFKAKSQQFRRIPRDGNILTLAKDPVTGHSEELDFLKGDRGASDAASDARLLRLLISAALAVPPTWLGDAESSNRASSAEMNGPPLIAMKRRQSTFRGMMTRIFRLELLRRFGPEKRYLVRYSETKTDRTGQPIGKSVKTKRVPAELLDIPWTLPQLNDATLDEIIRKVEMLAAQGLASKQTQQELIGLDVSEELERLGNEGGNAPQPSQTVTVPPAEPADE